MPRCFMITAFGVSITYIATSEILAHHFDRHKYLAFSLAVLGKSELLCNLSVIPQESSELDFGFQQNHLSQLSIFWIQPLRRYWSVDVMKGV